MEIIKVLETTKNELDSFKEAVECELGYKITHDDLIIEMLNQNKKGEQ